jgi:hypothetical protein
MPQAGVKEQGFVINDQELVERETPRHHGHGGADAINAVPDLVDTGAGIRIADHVDRLQIAVLALSTVATGLPLLRVAEVCEGTGHKNAEPTHPERNAQAADLHLPS